MKSPLLRQVGKDPQAQEVLEGVVEALKGPLGAIGFVPKAVKSDYNNGIGYVTVSMNGFSSDHEIVNEETGEVYQADAENDDLLTMHRRGFEPPVWHISVDVQTSINRRRELIDATLDGLMADGWRLHKGSGMSEERPELVKGWTKESLGFKITKYVLDSLSKSFKDDEDWYRDFEKQPWLGEEMYHKGERGVALDVLGSFINFNSAQQAYFLWPGVSDEPKTEKGFWESMDAEDRRKMTYLCAVTVPGKTAASVHSVTVFGHPVPVSIEYLEAKGKTEVAFQGWAFLQMLLSDEVNEELFPVYPKIPKIKVILDYLPNGPFIEDNDELRNKVVGAIAAWPEKARKAIRDVVRKDMGGDLPDTILEALYGDKPKMAASESLTALTKCLMSAYQANQVDADYFEDDLKGELVTAGFSQVNKIILLLQMGGVIRIDEEHYVETLFDGDPMEAIVEMSESQLLELRKLPFQKRASENKNRVWLHDHILNTVQAAVSKSSFSKDLYLEAQMGSSASGGYINTLVSIRGYGGIVASIDCNMDLEDGSENRKLKDQRFTGPLFAQVGMFKWPEDRVPGITEDLQDAFVASGWVPLSGMIPESKDFVWELTLSTKRQKTSASLMDVSEVFEDPEYDNDDHEMQKALKALGVSNPFRVLEFLVAKKVMHWGETNGYSWIQMTDPARPLLEQIMDLPERDLLVFQRMIK